MKELYPKRRIFEGECGHFSSKNTSEKCDSYIPKKNIGLKANVVSIIVGIQQRSQRATYSISQKRIFV